MKKNLVIFAPYRDNAARLLQEIAYGKGLDLPTGTRLSFAPLHGATPGRQWVGIPDTGETPSVRIVVHTESLPANPADLVIEATYALGARHTAGTLTVGDRAFTGDTVQQIFIQAKEHIAATVASF